jgi:hypothetical protein
MESGHRGVASSRERARLEKERRDRIESARQAYERMLLGAMTAERSGQNFRDAPRTDGEPIPAEPEYGRMLVSPDRVAGLDAALKAFDTARGAQPGEFQNYEHNYRGMPATQFFHPPAYATDGTVKPYVKPTPPPAESKAAPPPAESKAAPPKSAPKDTQPKVEPPQAASDSYTSNEVLRGGMIDPAFFPMGGPNMDRVLARNAPQAAPAASPRPVVTPYTNSDGSPRQMDPNSANPIAGPTPPAPQVGNMIPYGVGAAEAFAQGAFGGGMPSPRKDASGAPPASTAEIRAYDPANNAEDRAFEMAAQRRAMGATLHGLGNNPDPNAVYGAIGKYGLGPDAAPAVMRRFGLDFTPPPPPPEPPPVRNGMDGAPPTGRIPGAEADTIDRRLPKQQRV